MDDSDKDTFTPIGLAAWRALVTINKTRKEKPTPKREQLLDHGARDRNGNARGREAYMVKGKRRL